MRSRDRRWDSDRFVYADTASKGVSNWRSKPASPATSGPIERVESISEANDSATTCAKRLLGRPEPFGAIPWFWSDQGQLKLQIAGLCARSDDETCLISNDVDCVVIRHCGDRVTAVEAINGAREFMAARRLFESGAISLSALIEAGSVFDLLQSSRS